MRIKLLTAACALALSAPAMAATCTGTTSWGNLGPPGMELFGNSFNTTGSYLDCYSFSLTSAADSFGGTYELDWSWNLGIDLTSVSLFGGGVLGGQTLGSLVGTDYSSGSFSFGSLSAGTYTLAIASKVFGTSTYWDGVGYFGAIGTTSAAVASPAPEPGAIAMMLAGLVGVGAAVRRRKNKS
jgi:hypothetical protein